MEWTLAHRAERMNPSLLREILKVTELPGIISLAGGLPAPSTFPVDVMRTACDKVLRDHGEAALQYATSEGYGPLREWVAAHMNSLGVPVDADQVLITNGSQQGLDLIGKVLTDAGSRVLVETPTYLGALQAFAVAEPEFISVASDREGPVPEDMRERMGQGASRARFMYLIANFQNPTGRTITAARRKALMAEAQHLGLPIVEDNPYGDLWFDEAPPAPLASIAPEQTIYLGSFSKVFAPGLRLGYIVAPHTLYPKLLQAKQAADLHTSGFNQRVVAEVIRDGFLERHIPDIRALYHRQRDAMLAALAREMNGLDVRWTTPAGGMFLWLELPEQIDTLPLLKKAVTRHVAYVPGAAFYANGARNNTLRLSYVTASPAEIDTAIAALAETIRDELACAHPAAVLATA